MESRLQAQQGWRDYDTETWELYHLSNDWSECTDLAGEEPEKLAELIDLWWQEAGKHGVLPLDDRTIELFGSRFPRSLPHPIDKRYVYRPPMSPMPGKHRCRSVGTSFDLTARITRAAGEQGSFVRDRYRELRRVDLCSGQQAGR